MSSRLASRASSASPRPMPMIPMFSMLWYASSRFRVLRQRESDAEHRRDQADDQQRLAPPRSSVGQERDHAHDPVDAGLDQHPRAAPRRGRRRRMRRRQPHVQRHETGLEPEADERQHEDRTESGLHLPAKGSDAKDRSGEEQREHRQQERRLRERSPDRGSRRHAF
jgi:hypothetical protein